VYFSMTEELFDARVHGLKFYHIHQRDGDGYVSK